MGSGMTFRDATSDGRAVCGRFAPTPSGPLHFGSILAALASFLNARSQGGAWRLRIDDLDEPRVVPGASDQILRTLEAFGFDWDGEVVYQSRRQEAYREAFSFLKKSGALYRCSCSRRDIGAGRVRGVDNTPVYPGTCREAPADPAGRLSWRFRVPAGEFIFTDAVQGERRFRLEEDFGDFVVVRADNTLSYHVATVIDDHFQGVTEVVRGSDLLGSACRQALLYRALALPWPVWAHIPVAVDENGDKLSKQTKAAPVCTSRSGVALWEALAFLGQGPPPALRNGPPAEVIAWGRSHWAVPAIPARESIRLSRRDPLASAGKTVSPTIRSNRSPS